MSDDEFDDFNFRPVIERCDCCDAIISDDSFNENKRKYCSGCGEEGCQKCLVQDTDGDMSYYCPDEYHPRLVNPDCLLGAMVKRAAKALSRFILNKPALTIAESDSK